MGWFSAQDAESMHRTTGVNASAVSKPPRLSILDDDDGAVAGPTALGDELVGPLPGPAHAEGEAAFKEEKEGLGSHSHPHTVHITGVRS